MNLQQRIGIGLLMGASTCLANIATAYIPNGPIVYLDGFFKIHFNDNQSIGTDNSFGFIKACVGTLGSFYLLQEGIGSLVNGRSYLKTLGCGVCLFSSLTSAAVGRWQINQLKDLTSYTAQVVIGTALFTSVGIGVYSGCCAR